MNESVPTTVTALLRGRQWWLPLTIALLLLLLVFPYALAYLTSPADLHFTGILMNPEDSQSYFAKMRQGFDGYWRYTIPFTVEQHEPAFLGVFYLLLGHLARIGGVSLAAVWHVARIAGGFLLFLTTYLFIAAFVPDCKTRLTAYLLALSGSGLGWLLLLLGQENWLGAFPVDFKMAEAHLFFSAFTFPHVALGSTLILLTFLLQWRLLGAEEARPWRVALGAGGLNLVLSIVYPFLIYLVALTVGLAWLALSWQARRLRWRAALRLAVAYLIPAPLLLYYATVLTTNPVFRAWSDQAATLSPPWPHYLVAYGPMLLLALLLWRRRTPAGYLLLWAWVAAVALLVYAPLNPQRRFVQGVQVPLAILSAAALWQVVLPALARTHPWRRLVARPRYSTPGLQRYLLVLFLLLMSFSNIYVLVRTAYTAAVEHTYPLFRPVAEVEATAWLRQNSAPEARVLGEYLTGSYVAAHAGNRVVSGHWAETMDFAEKEATIARFFDAGTSQEERRQILAGYGIDYVWYGPREQALGAFDPAGAAYLEPVYAREGITIYAVSLEPE